MSVAILWLSVLMSLLGAVVRAAPEPVLRLVWADYQGRGRSIEPLVKAQLVLALKEAGVGVHWTQWDGSERDVHEGEIRILVSSAPSGATPANALGAARVEGASRWVTVYLGSVRRALRLDPRAEAPLGLAARRLFARAVTRIVLHELVHAGQPERPHAEAGLMAPSVGRRVLVAPPPPLEAHVQTALRDAARAPSLAKATAAAVIDDSEAAD
jgi:hypothetical protein